MAGTGAILLKWYQVDIFYVALFEFYFSCDLITHVVVEQLGYDL